MATGKKTKATSEKTAETEGTSTEESSISEALRNELILQTISSFLPLPDKKRFRLVNSTWNRASLIEIRKHSGTIDLGYGSRLISRHAKQLKETSSEGLDPNLPKGQHYYPTDEEYILVRKALIQLINQSKCGFPCGKFNLNQMIKHPHFLHEFLQAVGGFVEKLKFSIDSTPDSREFPENLNYSNLRSIELSIRTYPTFSLDQWFLPILEKASVLNTLSFISSCSNILSCCIDALDNPHGRKVKNLHLQGYITDEHLYKLSQIGLTLTKLDLVLDKSSQVDAKGFLSVFQSQSQTLLELHINGHNLTDGELTIKFPRMEKLKSLKMEILFAKVHFPGLDYAQQFPVLEQLSFAGFTEEYVGLEEIFDERMKPLKTVEKLRLPQGLTSVTKIIQAGRVFPNVKRLEICCSAEKLKIVGVHMKNVEELTYKFNNFDLHGLNKVLTGYTSSELACLERVENRVVSRKVFLIGLGFGLKKPLDFLNKLRILRIEYAEISNWMCDLGLKNLTNLKLLDLRLCRKLEITQEILVEMRQKFVVLLPKQVRFRDE